MSESMEERITRLLLNHAQNQVTLPLSPALDIRQDLAVESLSLVSVLVDVGADLGVDVAESGIDFGRIQTVGDLVSVANELAAGAAAT